jgi:hypothetical protein
VVKVSWDAAATTPGVTLAGAKDAVTPLGSVGHDKVTAPSNAPP